MEIQQSKPYANFIRSLGWQVITHNRQYYYLKRLSFMGALLKVQRVIVLPDLRTFLPLLKQERVTRLAIEPDSTIPNDHFNRWIKKIPKTISVNRDPFLPTKTIRVDLAATEDIVFHRFSEAKRRAVRRAQKNSTRIELGQDIENLIRIKNTSAGFLGFITTYGLDKLWPQFALNHSDTLLAYTENNKLVGGILLLYWNRLAYYWVAGATKEGKRLFAPTLLVWEALKLAKKRRCTSLDFVGVWDERMPKQNHQWKGFTKFKEGFGGEELYYPIIQ